MNADSSDAPDLFLTTRWSLVLKARSDHATEALHALDDLCSAYWYPVYAFIRRTCASPEDAEDLTQSYFAGLMERGYLDRASRDKGKLRAFLLADVKLFLSNERGRQRSAKRGGGRVIESFGQAIAEQRYDVEPADHNSPEQLFDRAWATTLLSNVQESLRSEFAQKDKQSVFEVLQQFIAWNAGDESYADVATKLGKTVSDVKVSVHRMRKRYRVLLEQAVADTVSSPEEVAQEISVLAAVFA
jgi:RNA polymerase sigma-70 factor (ECF subfamily)